MARKAKATEKIKEVENEAAEAEMVLIPVSKVAGNQTVEGTGKLTEDGKFEYCVRKA